MLWLLLLLLVLLLLLLEFLLSRNRLLPFSRNFNPFHTSKYQSMCCQKATQGAQIILWVTGDPWVTIGCPKKSLGGLWLPKNRLFLLEKRVENQSNGCWWCDCYCCCWCYWCTGPQIWIFPLGLIKACIVCGDYRIGPRYSGFVGTWWNSHHDAQCLHVIAYIVNDMASQYVTSRPVLMTNVLIT